MIGASVVVSAVGMVAVCWIGGYSIGKAVAWVTHLRNVA